MYLTCNPGGVGHGWVKRLFIDRDYRGNERAEDYRFIRALVTDNEVLMAEDPDYLSRLSALPQKLRDAWLYGRWDIFEGQFFPEFDPTRHVVEPSEIPKGLRTFVAVDYGFDMLAALLLVMDEHGNLFVEEELCRSGLVLSEAAREIAALCRNRSVAYCVASPDLWNRRQDSGRSGFEVMQQVAGMPPMMAADDRRIPGWRLLRQYLCEEADTPKLRISSRCDTLIRSLPALLCDTARVEDASDEPHEITHAPEALRYGVMSRVCPPNDGGASPFTFASVAKPSYFD